MPTSRPPYPLTNLVCALLAGPWSRTELLDRALRACPHDTKLVRAALRRALKKLGTGPPPSYGDLLAAFLADPKFVSSASGLMVGEHFWLAATMAPVGAAARSWQLPAIVSPAQLADWLNLPIGRLDWLSDTEGWTAQQSSGKLQHYVRRWQLRRSRSWRLIESPKPMLKHVQRGILRGILDRIPAHGAAHGFRSGRSIVTYAAAHAARRIVLRFDLCDFFPSIGASRVHALFRTCGYPNAVARLLTGLCTTCTPQEVWHQQPESRKSDSRLKDRLLSRHLPQGAPTSPALANLSAYRLDLRLSGLARAADAVYTRYADDLAFSGGQPLERSARRFQVAVAVIAAEEGFDLHFRKSRFMRQAVRQQLSGIVLNVHPNVRREKYDELKAILWNCIKTGPASQNRDGHPNFRAHLQGRIAHVNMIHPNRAAKLRLLFERIAW